MIAESHDETHNGEESLLNGHLRLMEMLALGKPMAEVLDAALRFCESRFPEMLCSILVLDADGKHLRHGAAPHLPAQYMRDIDGRDIGPQAGSCGTAAYRGEPVIVEDIASDPLWSEYKEFALPHGLRACWSTPIFDSEHKVLGTFAIYYRKSCLPAPEHLRLIAMVTHLAGIAIAMDRASAEHRRDEERLRQSEKMTAVGQLAGGVAHDFNNQLSVMLGYAQLLDARITDPDAKRFAASIIRAALRSGELTRNLLAFSRQGHLEYVSVDVHELIEEVAELFARSVDKRISIELDLRAAHPAILGDPATLQNALLNLALNGRDAMPQGGALTIATEELLLPASAKNLPWRTELSGLSPGRYLHVTVADTGTGMSEEVKRRIFEPFFTTKPVGKGTGMGLASVHGTVASHKGRIAVETEPGRGTRFHLCLPASSRAAHVESAEPIAPAAVRPLRILVVEDEKSVRDLIKDMLHASGHEVTEASGGGEAAALYRELWRDIDLVILDMVMADLDGYQTWRELRAVNPQAKVLISSGYSRDGKVEAALAEGAKGLLQKPYEKSQLDRMIATAIG